ncbi:MAG: hypothetical protein RL033_366 [Pseudomonadota bacterium]
MTYTKALGRRAAHSVPTRFHTRRKPPGLLQRSNVRTAQRVTRSFGWNTRYVRWPAIIEQSRTGRW